MTRDRIVNVHVSIGESTRWIIFHRVSGRKRTFYKPTQASAVRVARVCNPGEFDTGRVGHQGLVVPYAWGWAWWEKVRAHRA